MVFALAGALIVAAAAVGASVALVGSGATNARTEAIQQVGQEIEQLPYGEVADLIDKIFTLAVTCTDSGCAERDEFAAEMEEVRAATDL